MSFPFISVTDLLVNHVGTTQDESLTLRRQPSFKWANSPKANKSPTKLERDETPHPSPQRLEHDIPPLRAPGPSPLPSTSTVPEKAQTQPGPSDSPKLGQQAAPKPVRQDSSDNLKSFKVSLDDPTWKVLPAALKKYRINNDNWENYAMFICYGAPGAFTTSPVEV